MAGLCTLTALHWTGELPTPGHYLKAERGRTAFLIVQVLRPKRACGYVARFRCERTRPADLPVNAMVHVWVWGGR